MSKKQFKVITLCGSTRFADILREAVNNTILMVDDMCHLVDNKE